MLALQQGFKARTAHMACPGSHGVRKTRRDNMSTSDMSTLDLLQHCRTIADFMTLCEPNACGGFLREFLHSHFDQIPATLTGITHDVTAGTAGGGDTEQSRRPRLL